MLLVKVGERKHSATHNRNLGCRLISLPLLPAQDALPAVVAGSTPEVLAPITLNLSPAVGSGDLAATQQRAAAVAPSVAHLHKASTDDMWRFLTSPPGESCPGAKPTC